MYRPQQLVRRSFILARIEHLLKKAGVQDPHELELFSLSAMIGLDQLRSIARRAQPGQAWLVHAIVPHEPFVFDAQCRPVRFGRRLPAGEDTERAYVEQQACVHRHVMGLFDGLEPSIARGATVIVHGDHGARLLPPGETDESGPRFHNTLYAVRAPDIAAGLDPRILPLDVLLSHVVDGTHLPGKSDKLPVIWERRDDGSHIRKRMPAFEWRQSVQEAGGIEASQPQSRLGDPRGVDVVKDHP